MMAADQNRLLAALRQQALALGFTDPKITSTIEPWAAKARLHDFIAKGRHGQMQWMAREAKRRQHPNDMWAEAKSAIVLGFNYGPNHDPMDNLNHSQYGNISVYARGHDYHELVKKRLKTLAGWLHKQTGEDVKVFVDTAPLMEKPLAAKAGLGWQGKHTNLVSRDLGSWMFLGVILSAAELPPDLPSSDNCGSCQACLDICPTDAFVAPYQLDASACISYLTIEHNGHIPQKFRKSIGNRIYGCDDCLAVCPWNKYAQTAHEAKLRARPELSLPLLADLAALDDDSFRQVFRASPIKRTGRDRFVRNVMIAIGNSSDPTLANSAIKALGDRSELVRAMAVWALAQLLSHDEFILLRTRHVPDEADQQVIAEWQYDQGLAANRLASRH